MTLFFVFEVRCCSKKHISDKFLHYYLQELHFYPDLVVSVPLKMVVNIEEVEIHSNDNPDFFACWSCVFWSGIW